LILLEATVTPPVPADRRHLPVTNETAPLAPVEPPTPPPPQLDFPTDADTSIDWNAEARRAAAAVTAAPSVREFGRTPKGGFAEGPKNSAPRMAGEQYREGGDWIVWVSDRCYIVSAVPPVGLPDVLARSIPTRTVCKGNSGPRSDLFKDLPAYRKYHPSGNAL
jgi:hypothetical protein